jgi:hypothetical protein
MRALILTAALALSACQRAESTTTGPDSVELGEGVLVSTGWGSAGVGIWVDPDTGCEYLIRYDKALTPRMERHTQTGMIEQRGCR